ncbi:hypothetical protein HGP28_09500 [Vibrio sp. SM6]|uniref:Lipoprotein n=1 Tax=Vibrio agarilyticus TaxID=2726741 RepID=A0A7X8TRX7_9VIBR|nr:YajG family lipoprotein [Vibrio agarilyticus]NLS13123.1 hypothetical protein [Vibrio agarilyticus]
MKKWLFTASLVLLTACSAPQPPQLNFAPQAFLSTNPIADGKSFTLTSKDVRTAQYVALVDSGRANVIPLHAQQNLRITLENQLAKQLASQGFHTSMTSNNSVTMVLQDALVNVKHSVMENEMDALVVLAVTAETPKGKLVKTYTGTAKRTGVLSASDQDIEMVLNDVTNLVLADIAADKELQNYMRERF